MMDRIDRMDAVEAPSALGAEPPALKTKAASSLSASSIESIESIQPAPALHGGRIQEAARRFNRPVSSFVDFSSNMNVFAPRIPEDAWARWREEATRYPEDDDLQARLAALYQVPAECVLPTAGAIEGIYLAARLFRTAAVPAPAFGDYKRAFQAAGATVFTAPPASAILLAQNSPEVPGTGSHPKFHPDATAEPPGSTPIISPSDDTDTEYRTALSLPAAAFPATGALILGNPNNPSGELLSVNTLLELARQTANAGTALLVDEAFIEFAAPEESLLPWLAQHPHVIVFRSLTKCWNIPGLRLGFVATANPAWMRQMHAMQPPWSVGGITAAWARENLTPQRHREMLASLAPFAKLREDFQNTLRTAVPGIAVHPASANFFLVELTDPRLEANALFARLAERGYLVRVCDSFQGLEKGRFIRLAVRSAEENRAFTEAFAGCVRGG